jgi:hypothetical protein
MAILLKAPVTGSTRLKTAAFRWVPIAAKALAVAPRALCMERGVRVGHADRNGASQLIDYGIKCSKVVKLEITQIRRV